MRKIYIDTDNISEVCQLHRYLKDLFDFPDYYGMNLDSLYDCLGSVCEATEITISSEGFSGRDIENYGARMIEVFKNAAEYNENLMLRFRARNEK